MRRLRAAEVEAAVKTAVDTYGRLACAHNNAGIEGPMSSTVDCSKADWDRLLGINLKGEWL